MLILFVEDDARLAGVTIDYLSEEGIEVDYAQSIEAAKNISLSQQYDAIVLDLELPDGLGFELVTYFQHYQASVPILFLTANHSLDSKLSAFSLGALDYITKPFELAELVARLKILWQKTAPSNAEHYIDTLYVNLASRLVKRGERTITLSPQQWQLLTLLIQAQKKPVTKSSILTTIWQDDAVTPDMYKSLITPVEKDLTQNTERQILHTIKAVGVALTCDY